MKNLIVAGIVGAVLLVAPVRAEDMKHDSAFCSKHCNSMQLKKEVSALEKEIANDKAAMKSGGSDKAATLNAKRERLKQHIDQHEKELEDLKTQLDKTNP